MTRIKNEDPRVQDLILRLGDRQVERLVDKEAADHVFSEAFESRMDALIQGAGRKQGQRRLRKKALRFASRLVAGLMVATLIFVGPEKVVAVARKLQMTLVGHFSDHDAYYFSVQNDGMELDPQAFELPTYVPEGFKLVQYIDEEDSSEARYENADKDFYRYRRVMPDNLTMGIDNEGVKIEYKNIEGRQMMVRLKEGFNSFIWDDGQYLYKLQGSLSEDEFLKIIQSLPEIEKGKM